MYHTQELQEQPTFTYHSTNPNPNPNPNPVPNSYFSYPQPTFHFPDPALHPPGTDPYANSGQYPLTDVGFQGQTQYYQDPNAISVTWVTRQAATVRYEPALLPSTSLNSSGNNYWANDTLANDVIKSIPTQSKVIQSMRCEVCNIDCNSKDVFEKHISGKKHQKNLQNELNPSVATLQNSCGTVNNISMPSQELEIKRQKLLNGGATVDSVRICSICNVACSSQEVFNKHLFGKKHAAQASLMSLNGVGQYFATIKAENNRFWSKGLKKTKIVQSAWCEVCKINCNSNDVYVTHLQGKKHQKNLENLQKTKNNTIAPSSVAAITATNPIIGPAENPRANRSEGADVQKSQKRVVELQPTVEDLETKKRKVVESGAAAGAVRVCTICNVVCNSQTVFTYHLAGQKHAAMVNKQAEA